MERLPRRRRGGAVVALTFLVLALLVWWHAWTGGAGRTLASGSVDPAQEVWFLAWTPAAIGHGWNPFFSRAMFIPSGLNLLANTSFLLLGLVLSPVTLLFGPVAALAVAVTLAPAADAFAAYAALRRYVSWQPAAFVGGLLYGFGPFVATDLRYGHLNLTLLVFPPLLVMLLDRLLFGPLRSARAMALAIGALLVAEFFVSSEMFALGVVVGVLAMAVVAVAARRRLADRAGYVGGALVVAAVGTTVALAYPVWWYLRGPRHFSGAVWRDMARFSASLQSFVVPHGELSGTGFLSGGNGDFLGVGLLVVLGTAAVVWRGDTVLRFALGMAGVSVLLALGPTLHLRRHDTGIALPAWPLVHLPLLDSMAPSRFGAFVDLFCALALARVVDHVNHAVRDHLERAGRSDEERDGHRHVSSAHVLLPAGVSAVVALGALMQPALAQSWPYPVQPLHEPAVVRGLDRLPEGSVVREFPLVSETHAEQLVWQASGGMAYNMVDGYAIVPGTGGRAGIRPPTDVLGIVFAGITLGRLAPPYTASTVAAVRSHAWDHGVRSIAVVRRAAHASTVEALLDQALGRPAVVDPSGWLWRRPASRPAGRDAVRSVVGGDVPGCGVRAACGSAPDAPAGRGRSAARRAR